MVLRHSLSGRRTHPPLLVLLHHPSQKLGQNYNHHHCKWNHPDSVHQLQVHCWIYIETVVCWLSQYLLQFSHRVPFHTYDCSDLGPQEY